MKDDAQKDDAQKDDAQKDDADNGAAEYRRTYLAELAAAAEAPPGDTAAPAAALETLREPGVDAAQRDGALSALGATVDTDPERIGEMLALLADRRTPAETRLGLLTVLQQVSFRGVLFPGVRPEYLETLRALVDDPDRTLRRRAIGVLARERDPYVQQRLVAGLEHRETALVPAAKAVQFLGYDMHAEYAPLLRRIVADPPNQATLTEALRLLAADPSAGDLLADVLGDRTRHPDVRTTAAAALQTADPERFARLARGIALDDAEPDDLRAAVVAGLSLAEPPAERRATADPFAARIADLRDSSSSTHLRRAADGYLAAQGR